MYFCKMDLERWFIIGMMGSGKTHYGRQLAERHGRPFYDLDAIIEAAEEKPIAELFEDIGELAFRKIEQMLLHAFCEKPGPFVLATGGGTPCFFDNMERMNAAGTTVYLQVPVSLLLERLRLDPPEQRPLLPMGAGLKDTLEELLQKRTPFYEQSKITLH